MKKCEHKNIIGTPFCPDCDEKWNGFDLVYENQRLRDALMFYADKRNWTEGFGYDLQWLTIRDDGTKEKKNGYSEEFGGKRARKALGMEE